MSSARKIKGTAVAPGLAMGPVHVVRATPDVVPSWSLRSEEVEGEIVRLRTAVATVIGELEERRKRVASQTNEKDAEIFAVHRMILQDPGAMKEVERAIAEQRINAEAAVQALIDLFEDDPDPLFQQARLVQRRATEEQRVEAEREVLDLLHRAIELRPDDASLALATAEQSERARLFAPYQVNEDAFRDADPGAIFMHCLPAHRGEEVEDEMIDGPRSVVIQQAGNRLHAQNGILLWCLS